MKAKVLLHSSGCLPTCCVAGAGLCGDGGAQWGALLDSKILFSKVFPDTPFPPCAVISFGAGARLCGDGRAGGAAADKVGGAGEQWREYVVLVSQRRICAEAELPSMGVALCVRPMATLSACSTLRRSLPIAQWCQLTPTPAPAMGGRCTAGVLLRARPQPAVHPQRGAGVSRNCIRGGVPDLWGFQVHSRLPFPVWREWVCGGQCGEGEHETGVPGGGGSRAALCSGGAPAQRQLSLD